MKKLFARLRNRKGFVLVEFVIALPLLILLIYALGKMTVQILGFAKNHAAEHVLESEAQYVIERISHTARAAKYVTISKAVGNREIYRVAFVQHVLGNGVNVKNFFKNKSASSSIVDAIDLLDTRFYTVQRPIGQGGYRVYAERKISTDYSTKTNPITGGDFLGDTSVIELSFKNSSDKVLHITLELQSLETGRKFRVSTAVFMSGCEKLEYE